MIRWAEKILDYYSSNYLLVSIGLSRPSTQLIYLHLKSSSWLTCKCHIQDLYSLEVETSTGGGD